MVTYWWEQSVVCTAPPPLLASCLTRWMASRKQSVWCCGSSQSQFSSPPAPCRPGRAWRGSPGCRHTWSPGPWGSPADAQERIRCIFYLNINAPFILSNEFKIRDHFKRSCFMQISLQKCFVLQTLLFSKCVLNQPFVTSQRRLIPLPDCSSFLKPCSCPLPNMWKLQQTVWAFLWEAKNYVFWRSFFCLVKLIIMQRSFTPK